jgi:hypothetical protein
MIKIVVFIVMALILIPLVANLANDYRREFKKK